MFTSSTGGDAGGDSFRGDDDGLCEAGNNEDNDKEALGAINRPRIVGGLGTGVTEGGEVTSSIKESCAMASSELLSEDISVHDFMRSRGMSRYMGLFKDGSIERDNH